MINDKTTLYDLSIFTSDGTKSVFDLIDKTTTQVGKEYLNKHILHPPETYEELIKIQDVIIFWSAHLHLWNTSILNGTIVMLKQYFESADHSSPSVFSLPFAATLNNILNKEEYSLLQFSLSHLADFFRGCKQLVSIISNEQVPELLNLELNNISSYIELDIINDIIKINSSTNYTDLMQLHYKARRTLKNKVFVLIEIYAKLDAWQSLARVTLEYNWTFPELSDLLPLCFDAKNLKHPLLVHPVAYSLIVDNNNNFLILTGANMAGKTTLLRAIGVSAFLAHLGMGVPAQSLKISFLEGIITNMHIQDNILKGESYFLSEVKRMKQTAEKLLQPKPHLALMDELFKGTNVLDAHECTKAVIEGLLNSNHHLMILSTHLYEVANLFIENSSLSFAYFPTAIDSEGNFVFTYQLKEGISNDRIGYKILVKEGVLKLLNSNIYNIQ